MKKLTAILMIAVITAVMFLSSCNKDEEIVLPAHEQLLIAHPWKFQDIVFDIADSVILGYFNSFEPALIGHRMTFTKDKKIVASGAPFANATWSMSSGGSKLTIIEDGIENIMDVKKLNDDELSLKQEIPGAGYLTITYIKD